MKRQLLSIVLVLAMIASCFSSVTCANVSATTTKKTVLSSKSVTMTVGQKKTLKLKNYKKLSKKNIKKVKWSTSNKKVVTVKYSGKYRQEGKLTAKKKGSAYIKVKYNGKTYSCKVTVKAKKKNTSNTEEPTTTEDNDVTTEENKPTTEENKSTTEEVTTEVQENTTKEPTTTEEPTTEEHICTWDIGKIVTVATCTADGSKLYTCTGCGTTKIEKILAIGHSYEGTITKEPTCVSTEVKTFTCSNCNDSYTEDIPATGHSKEVYGGLSTCHTKCETCGITIKNGSSHQYKDEIVTEANCTKTGKLKHTCECGYIYTEVIPISNEHTFNTEHECKVCGKMDEDNAVEITDISEEKDKSVLLYAYTSSQVATNGHECYDVYITSSNKNSHIAKHPNNFYNQSTGTGSGGGNFSISNIAKCYIANLTILNNVKLPSDCTSFFDYLGESVENISSSNKIWGIRFLDSSDVNSMHAMFQQNYLNICEIISFDTSNVTDMDKMFYFMQNPYITHLQVDFSDTSKVIDMSYMFASNIYITDLIGLDNFNTSNVEEFDFMFYNLKSLSKLDITNFDTRNGEKFGGMFFACTSLSSLKLGSNFDTSKATSMSSMFYNCKSITKLSKDGLEYFNLSIESIPSDNKSDVINSMTKGSNISLSYDATNVYIKVK